MKSIPTDNELKHAFLTAAKLPKKSYEHLTIAGAIDAARRSLAPEIPIIHYIEISRSGKNHEAARALAAAALGSTESATTFGIQLGEALKKARKELANEKRRKPLDALFYQLCGIKPEKTAAVDTTPIHKVLSVYLDALFDNIEPRLTHDMLRAQFRSTVPTSYITARLAGDVPIDREFIKQFSRIIKPFLNQGIKEGWLNETTKVPLSFEEILTRELKNIDLEAKTGKEALLYCIEKTGREPEWPHTHRIPPIPDKAIGPMIGEEYNWLSHTLSESNARKIHPVHVAKIAKKIAPYITHEKQWTGTLEITEPNFLAAHRKARNYIICKIEEHLPIVERVVFDNELRPLPETLGPTLDKLCEMVHIKHVDIPFDRQSYLSHIKSNCLAPHCTLGTENKKTRLGKTLDILAEIIVEYWPLRNQTPGAEIDTTPTIVRLASSPEQTQETSR
jgi:hypothetical protein